MPATAAETAPAVALRRPPSEPMVSVGAVSAPLAAIEVVAEPPTASVFAEKFVVEAPPVRVRSVVVALLGNGYPIAFVTVTAPVAPESWIPEPAVSEVTKLVEVAIAYVVPSTPAPRRPPEKAEKTGACEVVRVPTCVRLPTMVEDACEIKPAPRPRVVEVETPHVCVVNGHAKVA